MAIKGEIYFTGAVQGKMEGPRENGSSLIYEFKHGVYLPFFTEDSRIEGARTFMPFEVVKFIDRITPLLYSSLCTNEECTEIIVILYKIEEASGVESKYFQYTFKNARIISVENWMPAIYDPSTEEIGHLEKIKFMSKDIKWTYLDGGVEFEETAF